MTNHTLSSSDDTKPIASSTWTGALDRTILGLQSSPTWAGGLGRNIRGLRFSSTWTGGRAWGTPMEPSGDMGEHARTGPVQHLGLPYSSTQTGGRTWGLSTESLDNIEEHSRTCTLALADSFNRTVLGLQPSPTWAGDLGRNIRGLRFSSTWTGGRAWGTPMEPSGDIGEYARTGPVQSIASVLRTGPVQSTASVRTEPVQHIIYMAQITTNQEKLS